MPIGFSDLLKTTAQLDNNLTKGIVNTDETFGGVRSKIDDWTDLHLSTFNDGAGYTFQDDGTSAAPGHFKVYSTMFYVADGRSLVEDSTASSDYIRLDASGNYVPSGGTKYVVDSGTASPGYYVYSDATAVGGTGTGTDKLPKFTITGTQGSSSTALPAGYESFTSANNSSPAITVTDTNEDTAYNLVFSTAGTDQQLFVDATTTTLTYNPNSGTLNLGTSIQTVSLSTGTFGATGDIVSDLIPGNGSGVLAEKDLGSATHPWHELYVQDAIYFEGTANTHETKIVATDPSADRTITLPNASGTLAFENADTTGLAGTAGALATAGTIEFTGDVQGETTPTYTSGGDLSIAMTIQPDSVGLGDLVDIADERLLGRVDAGDGSVAELTKTQVLEMLNVADGADVTGNNQAASALVLANGRTFKVDLTSASASTAFDGSADITDVGVNGTLGVGNGGTGVTDNTLFLNSNVSLSGLGGGTIATQDADDVNIDGGAIDGTAIGANSASTGAFTSLSASGNLTVGGSLTVQGDFIQETSTNVIFEDTFLDLNVPDTITADITSDSGLRFGTAASTASVLSKHAQFMYDATADKFKFTREADAGNFSAGQAKSGADNVAALKFTKTDTSLAVDSADVADVYVTNSSAVSNSAAVRSLGAVAKCSISITTEATDGASNFAPVTSAAAGYPIKHNLGTQSIYVVAIKTSDGNTPIFCKYVPLTDDVVKVSVGITAENDTYDIIVIG